jgi:hypothetical protein
MLEGAAGEDTRAPPLPAARGARCFRISLPPT